MRLVVVGGVAGGASAAARARRLNEHAEIILLEKDEYVSFSNCGLPYYLDGTIDSRDKLFVAKPALFRNRFNIDVRVRNEAIAIDSAAKTVTVRDHAKGTDYELSYDKLVLSPGAAPWAPPIPGLDVTGVHKLRNVPDVDSIKAHIDEHKPKRAVVVGAGYIGLEVTESLVHLDVPTTIVEFRNQILPLVDAEMTRSAQKALIDHGVDLFLGRSVKSVESEDGAVCGITLDDGTKIKTDFLLMSTGVRPVTNLAESAGITIGESGGFATNQFAMTNQPDIYAVGDASEYFYEPLERHQRVALAGPANRAGRIAGQHAVSGGAHPVPPVLGTSIVKVFNITVGSTGLLLRAALAAGHDATAVTIAAKACVLGDEKVILKLVFERGSGRVLGATAFGSVGIDKRIDVIATAIRFRACVHDLTTLDLAYAPPFGAAKDPVHMAGFAASNVVDGLVDIVQADADLSNVCVLDVRTAEEVEAVPPCECKECIHIPIDELRGRVDELRRCDDIVVTCASGLRSYVACRMLSQLGFSVKNLSGGQMMRHFAAGALSVKQVYVSNA